MNAKPYDVIVFGATSFVGKLLCRYLASQFKSGELKWAAAGRSIEKLELLQFVSGFVEPPVRNCSRGLVQESFQVVSGMYVLLLTD